MSIAVQYPPSGYVTALNNMVGSLTLEVGDGLSISNTPGIITLSLQSSGTGNVVRVPSSISDPNLGTISSVALQNLYTGSFSATFTGPFTTPQVVTVSYFKIGRLVLLSIPVVNAAASNSGYAVTTADIPSGLLPLNVPKFPTIVFDNSGSDQVGVVTMSNAGLLEIFASAAGANFTGSGNCGWDRAIEMCYISAS